MRAVLKQLLTRRYLTCGSALNGPARRATSREMVYEMTTS
jgi:hypothetical protein